MTDVKYSTSRVAFWSQWERLVALTKARGGSFTISSKQHPGIKETMELLYRDSEKETGMQGTLEIVVCQALMFVEMTDEEREEGGRRWMDSQQRYYEVDRAWKKAHGIPIQSPFDDD